MSSFPSSTHFCGGAGSTFQVSFPLRTQILSCLGVPYRIGSARPSSWWIGISAVWIPQQRLGRSLGLCSLLAGMDPHLKHSFILVQTQLCKYSICSPPRHHFTALNTQVHLGQGRTFRKGSPSTCILIQFNLHPFNRSVLRRFTFDKNAAIP